MSKRLLISVLAAFISFLGLNAAQVALVTERVNYTGDAPKIQFDYNGGKTESYTKEINSNLSVELNDMSIQKHAFSFVTQSTFNVKFSGDCTVNSILFADVELSDKNDEKPLFETNGTGKVEILTEITPDTRYVDILWTGPAQKNLSFKFNQDLDVKHILIVYDATTTPEKDDFNPGFTDLNLKVDDIFTLNLPSDAPSLNFSTTNASVATVEMRTGNYVVNARGAGEAVIEAKWDATDKWNAGKAEFNVKVETQAPSRQDFAPNFENLNLTVGDKHLLTLPTDAPDIYFSSNNTSVATVDNYTVNAVGPGEATIQASWQQTDKWNAGSASFTVKVTNPAPPKQDFVPVFSDLELNVGESRALNLPADAPAITFSSSNAAIANVENNTVKAYSAGVAIIAATWSETDKWKAGSAFFNVTVKATTPTKQDFVPGFTDINLNVGESHSLNLPNDAPNIRFNSSNASVATVEGTMVKALAPGDAMISASWDETDKWKSGNASFNVKVAEPSPQKQDFVPGFENLNLTAGDSHALSLPTDAPNIQYNTSNAAIAFVENNAVKAVAAGEATIVAIWAETDKWKSGTASFNVKVTEPAPQKQDFVPGFNNLNLTAGDSHALDLPTDAPNIQYNTSNAAVAVVENNKVKAIAPGEATISATWAETDKWKAGSASFNVKVTEPAPQKQDFVPGFRDLSLTVGDNHALNLPADAPGIQYNTSNASVATVINNVVKAIAAGEAVIAATWSETDKWNSGSSTFRVVVNAPSGPVDPMLRFQHSEVRGQMGWGAISQAAIHLGDGQLHYSSSDPRVAEVDASTGNITKVNREGQTLITATLDATPNYNAATASYILKIESAPTDRDFKFDRISSGGFARTPFTLNRINKNYVQYTIDGLQRYDYSIIVNDDILEVTVRNEGIYTLRASAADGTGYALMQLVIFPCIEITPTGGMIDPEHSDVVLFEATGGSVKIGFNNSPMYMVYIDNVPFSVAEIPVANDMSVYYTLRYASMPFNVGAWLHLIIKPYAPSYRYDTASGQYIINSDEGHILYRILDGSGTENWTDTGSTELRLGKEHFAGKESIDIQLKTRKPTKRPGYEAESGISTYTLSASGSTGIEDVLDDNEAPSQLYDLNGRLISADTPAPGIYILKRGFKTTKVYIK